MGIVELLGIVVGAVAGSSVLTAWVTARSMRKKFSAEADKTSVDAANAVAESAKLLVETMRIDMKDLKEEVKIIRGENLILQKRVFELEAELKVYKTLGAIVPTGGVNASVAASAAPTAG